MAEKFDNARSNLITVLVNFRNLRFMALVKENWLISDFMKAVESTLAGLCSVNVKIKTLKNSINAILPHWYPVSPLLRDQDEVFAYTASDALNCSCSESDDSSKKAKDAKKVSEQKSSAVKKNNTNTKNIKTPTRRTNTSSKTGQKTPQKNLAQGTIDETDSSEDWTDDKHMQVDQKNEKSDNKAISRTVNTDADSLKKRADSSRSSVEKTKPNESMGVNVEKPDKENERSRVNAPVVSGVASESGKAKDATKSCRKEGITSDDSSEDSGTVDEIKNKEVGKTTVDDTAEVSDGKDKEIEGSTLITDKSLKKTKKSGAEKVLSPDSMSKVAPGPVSADTEQEQVTDIDTPESNTAKKGMRKKNAGSNEKRTSGKIVEEKVKSVSNIGKNSNKLDTKKKPEMTGKDKSDKMEDNDSSDDSSSSSDTDSDESSDETSKKPKRDTEEQQLGASFKAGLISKNENVSENAKKVENISPKASGKETESVRDKNLNKKGENKKAKKSSEKAVVSSDSVSSWSSEEEVQTRNEKTSKLENETKIGNEKVESQTGNKKDEEQTDVVAGDKSKARLRNKGKEKSKAVRKTAKVPKNGSKSETEIGTKSKSKRKDAKLPPSPAKSVGYKKNTLRENNSVSPASPAKSVARIAKSVSTKNIADSTKAKKIKVQVNSDDQDSDSTVFTLKAPFTQLPAKDKMKSRDKDQSESGDDFTEDGAGVGEKDKVKRKSAALLSASKVTQWLLSNPVSEDVAEMSLVDSNIPVSPKRKLYEVSGQGMSTKSKKSKNKKETVDGKKQEIQRVDGKPQEKQEQPSAKDSVTSNKGKKRSLLLPKISNGLAALAEDESDYSIKSGRNSKKRKLALPAVTRSGFLTPSKTVRRKSAKNSKKTNSCIKKVSSSQQSKTVEMNAREKEFLDSGLDLDTLFNDESIKW